MQALAPKQGAVDTHQQFAAGDIDAFEQLFRQHQHDIRRWIVRLVRNPAVADELTIETFWRAWRHRRRFDPARPFGAWTRRIATRVSLDYLRTAGAREPLPAPEPRTTPPDPALAAEVRAQLALAFYALPPRLRVAAQLALIDECPYQEIADVLDISTSAVKMRVNRAVKRLRITLERMDIRP